MVQLTLAEIDVYVWESSSLVSDNLAVDRGILFLNSSALLEEAVFGGVLLDGVL